MSLNFINNTKGIVGSFNINPGDVKFAMKGLKQAGKSLGKFSLALGGMYLGTKAFTNTSKYLFNSLPDKMAGVNNMPLAKGKMGIDSPTKPLSSLPTALNSMNIRRRKLIQ